MLPEAKTGRASSATYPRIEQSGGLYLPYVKFGAGGPNDTIELLGRYRSPVAAERSISRAMRCAPWGDR
jgi:hypothetical protein